MTSNLISLIFRNKHKALLLLMVILYIVYFTTIVFLKHDNFYTGRFDLGNMDQVVWNTIQGRIFQFTDPDSTQVISRLAYHSDFILVLLSPLYLIWSDPKVLLLTQTVTLAIGAVFLFLISNLVLKNKYFALTISFMYLINPAVQYTNLYDFHAVTLATTFLLATFYFLIKRRLLLFIIFGVLSALTKEQVWLIIALLGLYVPLDILLKKIYAKKFRINKKLALSSIFGLITFLICLFIFYSLVSFFIPNAKGNQHFALSYYSNFGNSPFEIIKNIVFSPAKTIGNIMQKDKIEYLFQIFTPVGFLPFFNPVFLIFSLPDFMISLFSNNKNLYQIYYQYTSTITPFIFLSLIYGIKTIQKIIPKLNKNLIIVYLISFSIYGAYTIGPMPGAKNAQLDAFTKPYWNKGIVSKYLSEIPKQNSVAATNNLGAHLSQREKIYTIPIGLYEADYVAFLLNDQYAQPSLSAQKEMAKKLKTNVSYELLVEKEDFIVFRKKR